MIRDLLDTAIGMVRDGDDRVGQGAGRAHVEDRLLDYLLPRVETRRSDASTKTRTQAKRQRTAREAARATPGRRDWKTGRSRSASSSARPWSACSGRRAWRWTSSFRTCSRRCCPPSARRAELSVRDARKVLFAPGGREAARPRQDHTAPPSSGSSSRESSFSTRSTRSPAPTSKHGPDVSRQGVQRDLLPIVEGSTVITKYGPGEDRPHPVHRGRRVPQQQAQRPDARAAGPVSRSASSCRT